MLARLPCFPSNATVCDVMVFLAPSLPISGAIYVGVAVVVVAVRANSSSMAELGGG